MRLATGSDDGCGECLHPLGMSTGHGDQEPARGETPCQGCAEPGGRADAGDPRHCGRGCHQGVGSTAGAEAETVPVRLSASGG